MGEAEAAAAAAQEPAVYEVVSREHGRIFDGLRVDLDRVSEQRMEELVTIARRHRVPKRVAAAYDKDDRSAGTPRARTPRKRAKIR